MPAFQAGARLVRFGVKARRRASINNLRAALVADQQHVRQAFHRRRVKFSLKFSFR